MTPAMTLAELLHELRVHKVRMWEDGGQLRFRAPSGVLTEALLGELRQWKPDLLALLAKSRDGVATLPIPRLDRGGALPLSPAQRRLWFLEQIRGAGPSAYNISTAFLVRGPLDLAALAAALADLVERHEVLRTGVRDDRGEPRLVLGTWPSGAVDVVDLSAHPDPEASLRADARVLAEAPFDLSAPPLLRFAVRRLNPDRHGCIVVLHHLVADGASMPILMSELAALYRDRRRGRVPGLPTPKIQYADFAAWQNALIAGDAGGAHREYWRRQFAEAPEPLDLPADVPRPPIQTVSGDEVQFRIESETADGLRAIARAHGASLFMTLLAGVAVLLHRYTGREDLTIGTPVLGRPHPDLDDQVGCYVNTLALRSRLDRHGSFGDLLGRVRDTVTDAFDHEIYPFDRVVDDLALRRDTGRSPLFDVMVTVAATSAPPLTLDGVDVEALEVPRGVSQFDLTFSFAPSPRGLEGSVQYRTDLFRRARIERIVSHLATLFDGLAADSSRAIGVIPILTHEEHQQVLLTCNETAAPYSSGDTIVSRFVAQAAATPDAVAVMDGDRRWSYGEIDARSNGVAAGLLRRGIGLEARVAIQVQRGEPMMTGLLGILKAGAAYVPIQPADARKRIAAMLEDCRPAAILDEREIARLSTDAAAPVDVRLHPSNLAYVLYTSGSTGTPKGVQIQHGSVVNRIEWMHRQYGLARGDVVLQKTPYTFDVSVWELFWWAFSGASVAFLAPDAEKDPAAIVDAVHACHASRIHFVPSMLRTFLEHLGDRDIDRIASLRDVFASGEALPADLAERFRARIGARNGTRLHNLYGPTEATVDVSFFDCARLRGEPQVPIGAPVANTQLYVLSPDMQPAPLGVPGEIFIGGVNVGRGYLGRPDLTAERFVPDLWGHEAGARLYRTGDIGRWRDDGQIEFLGRNDHQVKIRGNRVELGEIESALRGHPAIRDAAVLVSNGELIAYLLAESPPTSVSLRAFLGERLPGYMVPPRFTAVDRWPLTRSGKLDRLALAASNGARLDTGRAHVEPRTDTERRLADVFALVLGVPSVGVDDDFFDRGGHSLMAARVVGRARQEHGLDVTLRDLFAHPTVAALARCAEDREPFRDRPLRAVEPQPHYPLSHAQRRLWLAEQRAPDAAAYNVAAAFLVSGPLDVTALTEAWQRLQRRHESLRTRFRSVHGEPRQEIADAPEIAVDYAETIAASFADEARRIAGMPFDLSRAPLVRMAVRKLADGEYGWVVVLHHLICDGWSMPILVRELVAFYEDARSGRVRELTPLRLQYKDFATWQLALVAAAAIEPHRRFWHGVFATAPPRLRLPFESPRGNAEDQGADRVFVRIDAARTATLGQLGRRHDASVFMTLLALVKGLLFRYTGERDVTVGTVTAGRVHPDLEGQIGFYVNTLALRSTLDPGEPFVRFFERLSESTLEAFDHQVYPFDRLVDELDLPADGGFPLFDVMVVLQNNETAEVRLPDLAIRIVDLPPLASKFDLSFHFAETESGLDLTLEFRRGRFERTQIDRVAAAFLQLVDAVLADPDQTLEALPLPADAVRQETIAVVSTFTAEPLEETLAFWMERLDVRARVAFAPIGQVFQQLLDPSSLVGSNRHGANVVLLRLSDWERSSGMLAAGPRSKEALAGHPTYTLANGQEIAHLAAYETEDLYREIFVDRVYARHGIGLRPGDVVFDVGANIGMFTLFARSCASDLDLYAFEPAPPAFEALRRNAAAYCPDARVFHCGLGATETEAPFTFYPKSSVFSGYHPDALDDGAAIRAIVRNAVEREGLSWAPDAASATDLLMADRLETETVQVPVRTVSGVLREYGVQRIDLLKIDAEKSEREILDGIAEEDWPKIRQVVIEIHDHDGKTIAAIASAIERRGFEIDLDQEARLQSSGLYTLYARRRSEARSGRDGDIDRDVDDDVDADGGVDADVDADRHNRAGDRNVVLLCDALRVAAERSPATPFVVVVCPESTASSSLAEERLAAGLAGMPGVTCVSSTELARTYPVDAPHDPQADELGLIPYTPELYGAVSTIVARRIHAARRVPFKVVALDADQTLWRGVIGEDGPEGIVVDGPRRALQEFMAAQRREGMLLCLVSKNEDEDVARAFERHPEMPLGLDDFAARRINWQPKSENLRSLAGQLGVGLDTFVFVDDSPLECAEVRAACPEVLTLCLPEADRIPAFLRGAWAFDRPTVTAEDTRRANFYAQAGDRERVRATAPTFGAFIAGLELNVNIAALVEADVSRAAQLTLRTNQFNTTTVRRSEAQIRALADAGAALHIVRVRDRFGDYGLVGLTISTTEGDSLIVDALLLSCRALGRGVEHRLIAHLGEQAVRLGLAHVDVRWSPTERNRPVRDFLDALPMHTRVIGGAYRIPAAVAAATVLAPDAPPAEAAASSAEDHTRTAAAPRLSRIEIDLYDAAEISEAARLSSRRRMPLARRPRRSDLVPPNTAIERGLAAIWSEILGVPDVGTNERFMDLGGHSLKAIRMLSRAGQRLGVDLTLGDLFADPTIAGLAARAASRDPIEREPIPLAPRQATYPLSHAQRRLWILHEMGGQGAVAYNNPSAFVLDGELDPAALEEAFRRLLRRHESLRTRFVIVDGEARQEIVDDPSFQPEGAGLPPIGEDAFVAEAARLAHEPLDFGRAPLVRAALRRLDGNRWGLALVIHHVVTDGWSMPILVRELLELYNDARVGVESGRPPLRIQYKDYAVWHDGLLASLAMVRHQAFWHDRFSSAPPAVDLPADGPRATVQGFRGDHLTRHLDANLTASLHALASNHGATLFMTLLSALNVLLFRYTGETDLTIGTPMTGRIHADLEDQVGLYVNTLALRTRVSSRERFASLLDRVRDETASAFEHQAYPFDRLVEELRLPRDLGRSPLFDVMLVVEQEEQAAFRLTGVKVRPLRLRHEVSRFDMTFHVVETSDGLELGVQYNSALFRSERVAAMARHLEMLLRSAVHDDGQPTADLEMVGEEERRLVLSGFAQGPRRRDARPAADALPPWRERTLVDLFREQVARTPDGTAVISGRADPPLTYRELDARSDRVARHLADRGVRSEEPVGVLAARSTFTVVALLGVLKAGAAYLPLDPAVPQARLDFMIADSGAVVVLRDEPFTAAASPLTPPAADRLAYIIYTSGSTGQPKGVGVTHASLVNMALDQIQGFGLGPTDVLGQFASAGFDGSLYETFLALLSGAALAIIPDEARLDREAFLGWSERVRPTALVLPPAFVRTLERQALPSVRLLVTAGEAADSDDARHYAGMLRYVNAYGPTECAVCSTCHDVDATHDDAIPIGRPLRNTTAYVLDPSGGPAPVGVPGELYLGGAGVARGYLQRPELTAARFVPDPFGDEPGRRLYRTGDLARWRADGMLEFLGRNDFQVNLHGHRIELGEVEAALRTHEGVRDAVVVPRGTELVAYVVGDAPTVDVLRLHVRTRLPEYMVPAHVVRLESLPMTPSGKVDRRALPAPEVARPALSAEYQRPTTKIERAIAEIWCRVLGLPHVGILDNFFDLGGNSILLASILTALRRDLDPGLTLLDLFTFPRIQDLAIHLASRQPGAQRDEADEAASRTAERADKQRAAFKQARRPRR